MVLLKRGLAGTISEWLSATEYITMNGNDNVVLCERGLRTFETTTRFTLDISAVPVIHKQSLFPICIDVSHPAGVRDLVPSLSYAAVAAGADSIMIRGALRRSSAAHAGSISRTGRAAARDRCGLRQEDCVEISICRSKSYSTLRKLGASILAPCFEYGAHRSALDSKAGPLWTPQAFSLTYYANL